MRLDVVMFGLITNLGAFVGCGFSSHGAGSGDDAGIDAEPPGVDACVAFATQVDTCRLTFSGDLTLSGTITYDTTLHELRVNGTVMSVAHMTLPTPAGNVDAIYAHNIRLTSGALLTATGMQPLAIVAGGSVTLEEGAVIDVGHGGAGALASCSNAPQAGGNNTGGAGGGGGGGYAASGGDGGDGNSDGPRAPGGTKGTLIAMPAGPRGGCPGAPGGTGNSPGGLGGLGGGALYVAAADRIELLGNNAALTAGGGGGHGGMQGGGSSGDAGGGGGGSGGMIFLEAPHVLGPHGRIAANGGGGGEGSNNAAPGGDGDPGTTTTGRAAGGAGGTSQGADGGSGGSLASPQGETVTTQLTGGGGGGGGGVGYIHVVSPDFHVESVSPAAQ